jgi:hypothetical protein
LQPCLILSPRALTLPHRTRPPRLSMLILFDHGTPKGLARALPGHTIVKAQARGWDKLHNGALLTVAEQASFHLLPTTDRRIRYQQNLCRIARSERRKGAAFCRCTSFNASRREAPRDLLLQSAQMNSVAQHVAVWWYTLKPALLSHRFGFPVFRRAEAR